MGSHAADVLRPGLTELPGGGGDAESWLSLQVAYDLHVAEIASADKIAKEVDPRAA